MSVKYICAAVLFSLTFCAPVPCFSQLVTASESKAAMQLYSQKNYAGAAAAFEKIISRQPTASYCYYAALANRATRKESRAQQLFQFIVSNFPNSPEAAQAKLALAPAATTAAATSAKPSGDVGGGGSSDGDLPASVKALIPADMLKMLETPAGKQAVADVMKSNQSQIATIRKAEGAGLLKTDRLQAAAAAAGLRTSNPELNKPQPFTAADIAKTGSAGIDQMYYPNCWFEASMAALADLPRGQRLIAGMIRGKGLDKYVVRFPGDGVEYNISLSDLNRYGIHDATMWASLIECAQIQKFPDNEGAEGPEGDMSRLEVGLKCMTGCKAEEMENLRTASTQELSHFIGGAVKSKNPIVCGTYHSFPSLPMIAIPLHAYTIIDFDPAKDMITLRNPHGKDSKRFSLPSDPNHLDFQQLDNGKFKMSVRTFQKYFYSVCRSFI